MEAVSSPVPAHADRLPFLDVLRGLAALAVVVEHGLEVCVPGFLEWSIHWFSLGQLGVTVFLLISGFIIPVSLERGGSNGRFWINRFFRLFPLYWATIGLFALYYALVRPEAVHPPHAWQWLVNLTMLQDFCRVPHVTQVFWTLTLELMFYVACSIFYTLGLLRRTGLLVLLGQAGLLLLGAVLPLLFSRHLPGGYAFLFLTMFVGTLFYRVTAGQVPRRHVAWLLGTLAPVALAVSYVSFASFERSGDPLTFHCVYAVWLSAYVIFMLSLHWRDRTMPGWLGYLGRISYSIYLVHACLILALPPDWPAVVYMPALLVGTAALSAATYHAIEMPGLRLGRRLLTKQQAAPAREERRQAA